MIGIPFRIVREGDESGKLDKTIYLATRRFGEAGKAMREARHEYYKHEFACARAAQRYQAADRRVRDLAANDPAQDEMEARRDTLLDAIRIEGDCANEAAQKLVLLSLTENYGRKAAEETLDLLTDREIKVCVTLIETGELPADFFGSAAARSGAPSPKPTGISAPGGSQPESSLKPDSRGRRSKGAK